MLQNPVDSQDVMLSVALAISAEEEQRRIEAVKKAEEDLARDEELARRLQAAEAVSSAEASTSPSELRDELERKMSQRLSGATFVRHVPKVNSVDFDAQHTSAAETDRQRLQDNLQAYGLIERETKGDGNCQFRALADQLWGTPQMHATVRAHVACQLRLHPQLYAQHVPEEYEAYCSRMAKNGTWGDHVTLQAAADAYGIRVNVMTSYAQSSFIEIIPNGGERSTQRALYLSFWAEVHYNSIYPASEPPLGQREKVFGSRKLYKLFHGQQDHTQ